MTKKEYSYYELSDNAVIKAIYNIHQMLQTKLSLPAGPLIIDKPLIECIISKLDPVFDKNGKIKNSSKKYKEITNKLIKEEYDQCSVEKFRKNWAIKWIKGDLESFFNKKISFRIITGELTTAVILGVSIKDFNTVLNNLSKYKDTESKRFHYILKILDLEEI